MVLYCVAYMSMYLSTFVWHSRLYTGFVERAKLLVHATGSVKSSHPIKIKGNPDPIIVSLLRAYIVCTGRKINFVHFTPSLDLTNMICRRPTPNSIEHSRRTRLQVSLPAPAHALHSVNNTVFFSALFIVFVFGLCQVSCLASKLSTT